MLNKTGITKVTGAAPVQILFNVQNQMSVGIKVSKSVTGTVTENGRKILKAGTPLNGDLTARDTAFVNAASNTADSGQASNAKPAVGILLHDIDVTDADANAALLIWGFVNLSRLDTTTAALITADRKTELAGKVWFLKD
mgnify:CR=1 FL=1